jgi:transposase, IS5 family
MISATPSAARSCSSSRPWWAGFRTKPERWWFSATAPVSQPASTSRSTARGSRQKPFTSPAHGTRRSLRLLEIGRVARAKGPINQDKLEQRYRQLLDTTSRVVGQARRFSGEIAHGMKRSANALKQLVLEGLRQELDEMTSRVRQVMKQTRARIFRGNTRSEEKLLSLFEPSTEVIRKGKAGKPNEFGKMVKLQEAENQIITDYEVYARRPHDSDLLIAAIETHQALLGRTPRLVAADAAFYSAKNEAAARAKGVKRVCIPNRSTKSLERKREQRKRWFRNGQKWRTGSEGRISVVKRRHGLDRCRYRGFSVQV